MYTNQNSCNSVRWLAIPTAPKIVGQVSFFDRIIQGQRETRSLDLSRVRRHFQKSQADRQANNFFLQKDV